MRRRLLVFARTLPEDWYYAKMGAEMAAVMPQHDESYKPIPKMAYEFWLADAIVGIAIQFWWTVIVNCKHPNMLDESYGGPESGCMAGSCPRCGFSFHTWLY